MIVFRVALKIDKPETIGAGSEMHTGLLAGHQHLEVCAQHLLREDLVPPGVRHIEAGVGPLNERMIKTDLVGEDTPAFGRQALPFNRVKILERRVGCETGA